MNTWNCCRTCLDVQSLNNIFAVPEYSEKYTEVIFNTTGIKVEINDDLPQKICSSCINIINISYKFRKKCEENQKILYNRLNVKQAYEIKIESENNVAIDISDLIHDCKSFNDNENGDNDYKSFDDNKNGDNDYKSFDDNENGDNDYKSFNDNENGDNDFNEPVETNDNGTIEFENSKKIIKVEKETKLNGRTRSKSVKKKKESGEKKSRVKEEIQCEYCNKILTSKLSLRNHYKIHTGFDVVCEHCGKKFITRRLLLMHCRAKHGYEKTDKCSYCDYRASNAEQVKIHERLHTGEKPYVCSSCGAGFHRKSSYLQHVAIHLPDKTVQCDQCPARFKSVTLMRIHKNRHRAPQYSFKCKVCDNNFARRRNVVRHLQRIHGLQPSPEHIDRLKIP